MTYAEVYIAAHRARSEAVTELFALIYSAAKWVVVRFFGMDARSKTARTLRTLNDRELNDIGLTRNDVARFERGGSLR